MENRLKFQLDGIFNFQNMANIHKNKSRKVAATVE